MVNFFLQPFTLSVTDGGLHTEITSLNLNRFVNGRTCPGSSPGSLLPDEAQDYVPEPITVSEHVYEMSGYFVWCRGKRALSGGGSQGVLDPGFLLLAAYARHQRATVY